MFGFLFNLMFFRYILLWYDQIWSGDMLGLKEIELFLWLYLLFVVEDGSGLNFIWHSGSWLNSIRKIKTLVPWNGLSFLNWRLIEPVKKLKVRMILDSGQLDNRVVNCLMRGKLYVISLVFWVFLLFGELRFHFGFVLYRF